MTKLTREDLMSLEEYAEKRAEFREQVLELKKDRKIALGDHATLYFENEQTIRYQIQEMLRIEKVFEAAGINEELEAYNPLIPDGSNWKATFMIEYGDPEERAKVLATLVGVEDKVWVQVDGFEKVYAIANEDLERSTEEKTSAVHFMRFELTDDMVKAVKNNKNISMGIDYEGFNQLIDNIPDASHESLSNDLS
ncbi:MAG: DUF3501 family protein [Gammaproteobacteria bacterium]|nr:DUF3501 family protein [Gammaproteobacteria bacterium]